MAQIPGRRIRNEEKDRRLRTENIRYEAREKQTGTDARRCDRRELLLKPNIDGRLTEGKRAVLRRDALEFEQPSWAQAGHKIQTLDTSKPSDGNHKLQAAVPDIAPSG
ncbi:hypothetical protein KM043_016520 [Ampulex compressa]|nr:hypothetical protein KM043_016520 [Ampulex compressa]